MLTPLFEFSPAESAACKRLIDLALDEDLGSDDAGGRVGDATSQAVIPADLPGSGTDGSVYSSGNGQENSFRRFAGNNGANPPVIRALVSSKNDPGRDANGALWADKAFGSWHTGICQFVFCDGSVKAIPTNININTLQLLAVRNDGQVIPDY